MRSRFFGGLLLALFSCSLTFGQISNFDLDKPIGEQIAPIAPVQSGTRLSLEGKVNPDEYILGPGDELEFNVWSGIELKYSLIVAPDGSVGISGVGEAQLAGLTLSEARDRVFGLSKNIYPKAKLSLRLVNIRTMKVTISGLVEFPGSYEVSSIDRVSSLVELAGGFKEYRAEDVIPNTLERRARQDEQRQEVALSLDQPEQDAHDPALRRIIVRGKDGSIRNVDYLLFNRSGGLENNPILMDGDEVHVPIRESGVGVVHVFGAVKVPGEYEFVAEDDIGTLIELAGGFSAQAYLQEATLVRSDRMAGENVYLTLNLEQPDALNMALAPEDRLFVRSDSNIKPKHFVVVRGEVRYPGVYPIEDNVTMLTSLIEDCEGFRETANLDNTTILRWVEKKEPDTEFDRLQVVPIADMTEMEYEYYKARTRQDVPTVAVDFERLFVENDESLDVALRDLDEIIIPTLSATVRVSGDVATPGLIKFRAGASYEYYIREAGGFTFNAQTNKLRLIKARTGVWADLKKKTPIEIGDTIFVPEKEEIDFWEVFKDVLLVLSQLATIAVLARSL